jgi:prepilin-type N-terminal cleavage/methylation domain-containing protein
MLMKLKNAKGFTLIEMVVAMAVSSIFMLVAVQVLSAGNNLYLKEMIGSNATGIIETAIDDIKNYAILGEDIEIYRIVTEEDHIVAGVDFKPLFSDFEKVKGTKVYQDGHYVTPLDSGIPDGNVTFTDPAAYYATAIHLGFKEIHVENGEFIQGLPYSKDYYSGLNLTMKITENIHEPGVFTIELRGKNDKNIVNIQSNVAVKGLNE